MSIENSLIFPGNSTSYVQNFVKGKTTANYTVEFPNDPSVGCAKDFKASYKCGDLQTIKDVYIPGESGSKPALFDCSKENNMCKSFRLTIGDDGNLILTNNENKQIWSSNTYKTGVNTDKYNAKNSKFGRNYLLSGETLKLGEFIGSPSGNCYLIMAKSNDGNGLQINYDIVNCDDNQIGKDENTNGLFSLANTAYNEMIGSKNKVIKKIDKLSETKSLQNKRFFDNTTKMKNIENDYLGISYSKPVVNNHTKQLEYMDQDRELFFTRYRYRRIAWTTLAILIVLAAIKISKNNTS